MTRFSTSGPLELAPNQFPGINNPGGNIMGDFLIPSELADDNDLTQTAFFIEESAELESFQVQIVNNFNPDPVNVSFTVLLNAVAVPGLTTVNAANQVGGSLVFPTAGSVELVPGDMLNVSFSTDASVNDYPNIRTFLNLGVSS